MLESRFCLHRAGVRALLGVRGVRGGATLALCLGVLSCQHFDRAKECRSLTRLVNPVLGQIDEAVRKAPESASTYRTVATEYERLASAIGGLRPQNRRVLDAATDYARLTREGARDARAFADALDSKDPSRIATARSETARTLKHESAALTHLDGVCRPPR